MKNKRQTIWLVSMLSLMVVLSAYYLFTDDSGSSNQTAESGQISNAEEASSQNTLEGLVLNEVVTEEPATGEQTDETGAPVNTSEAPAATGEQTDAAAPSTEGTGTETEAATEEAKTDEDVLNQLETQDDPNSAITVFENYQWERSSENSKLSNELMAAASDATKTPEENAKALEQLRILEEKNEKILGIEEQLSQQYANAIVQEEEDEYKVVVISEKLEAIDAVNIVDLVISELDVTQDKVRVQYVKE
ncbi:SpoIIIAH-like family protein [Paenibacillus urinalis]|uniref:SpoIIIAH-like family protein n=1 Tax=Paenibacillus urinalis TaxID=521520 RepID=A0AAX3MVG1_9BACL|nr:SpoIIIAH-like family protein [Paenibacillus urinalis]WDH81327.1 SpoIIIAH-like family protein [Paenibacillus urinalis]